MRRHEMEENWRTLCDLVIFKKNNFQWCLLIYLNAAMCASCCITGHLNRS